MSDEFTETEDLSFPEGWKLPAPQLEPEKPPLDIRWVSPKPVKMQAVLATAANMPQIVEWVQSHGHDATLGIDQLTLQTFEGPFTIRPGDVVLRKPSGAFVREEGEPETFDQAFEVLGPVEA
jgi:hypothetical protein